MALKPCATKTMGSGWRESQRDDHGEKPVAQLTGEEEGVKESVDQAEVAGEEDHDGFGRKEDERAEEGLASDFSEGATLTLLLGHDIGVASLLAHLLSTPLKESWGVSTG